MKLTNITRLLILLILLLPVYSCKKYLDASTDKKLVIISSLRDAQSLIDDYYRINYKDVSVGEDCADDYFLPYDRWLSMGELDRGRYVWNPSNVIKPFNFPGNDWSQPYDIIYTANTILDFIDRKVTDKDNMNWKNIRGQALFLRAKSFLQLAWVWSLAYDDNTGDKDLGLPLRLNPDFNLPSVRSSVKQTYEQIVSDFTLAASFLPDSSIHVIRASKAAAYGYLARTYLSMRKYDKAGVYADSCLKLKNDLLDFNNVIPDNPFPTGIGPFNREVIYECKISIGNNLYYGRIPNEIYDLYDTNDLRKKIFFRKSASTGLIIFMGSYEQDYDLFSGIATDEMLLMRAECYARAGNLNQAMEDLNNLLIKRWETGAFVPFTANDKESALSLILLERRKELLMRGLRWPDIKRLNKEGRNIVLTRTLGQDVYTLEPNDLRYALAIPEDVINLSGMPQNPR